MILKRNGIELRVRYNRYGYAIFDGNNKISKMYGTLEFATDELMNNKDNYFKKAKEERIKLDILEYHDD